LGITTFDHADIYGNYTNEAEFGKAFRESGIDREKIQLITKCGIQKEAVGRGNRIKHYNYSEDYILWSAEQPLKHLQTEYLDLLLLHRPSPLMHPDPIARAITKLKNQGKIKSFGVSNFTASQIAMIESSIPVSANQVEFSLTSPGVMYDGTLDDCITNGRMAMSWSPLGIFFKENNPQTARIAEVIAALSKKYESSADQLLLAWILKHPVKVFPVVGTATVKRIKDAMSATKLQLELEDWFLLLKASQGHEVP
ncbi:MAG: aldo/keto reductase, partial [Flavobacteriales bacterium]